MPNFHVPLRNASVLGNVAEWAADEGEMWLMCPSFASCISVSFQNFMCFTSPSSNISGEVKGRTVASLSLLLPVSTLCCQYLLSSVANVQRLYK